MKKHMTRLLSLVLAAVLLLVLLPARAEAASVVASGDYGTGRAKWTLYDDGRLTISGGQMSAAKPLAGYADRVTTIEISNAVEIWAVRLQASRT